MDSAISAEQAVGDDSAIRPFQVGFPQSDLTELRSRVDATRWPERETVTDDSQGVPLALMQELARYWASASDAFHLVIPSLPGHGFSAKPTKTGWDPVRIARGWAVLMERLRYSEFVAQGGDWGRRSPRPWRYRRPRGCLGFTPTCPVRPQPIW